MRKFNLLIKSISPEDKIGHLFIIDIKLNEKNADEKNLLFNEIYTPIFQKDKCLDPSESSVFQLLDTMSKNYKGDLNSYRYYQKTHATMKNKFYSTLRRTYSLLLK